MSQTVYRYEFEPAIETDEVEATLALAIVGTEALHGETATQLGASHYFDTGKRVCVVDADGEAGRDFNSLFVGFLRREFGPTAFHVRRAQPSTIAAATPAA